SRTPVCIDRGCPGGFFPPSLALPAFFSPVRFQGPGVGSVGLWPFLVRITLWSVGAQAAIPRDFSSNGPETVIQAVRNRSISSSVVVGPRLTRTAERATARAAPLPLCNCYAFY